MTATPEPRSPPPTGARRIGTSYSRRHSLRAIPGQSSGTVDTLEVIVGSSPRRCCDERNPLMQWLVRPLSSVRTASFVRLGTSVGRVRQHPAKLATADNHDSCSDVQPSLPSLHHSITRTFHHSITPSFQPPRSIRLSRCKTSVGSRPPPARDGGGNGNGTDKRYLSNGSRISISSPFPGGSLTCSPAPRASASGSRLLQRRRNGPISPKRP